MTRLVLIVALAWALSISCPTTALSQLSPGDLHKSHEYLEGIENCTKCHTSGSKDVASNCLKCHTPIADQLQQKSGLHGIQNYQECQLCHVEHHGRDFQLIHWDMGQDNFDHSLTGFALVGKHQNVECRQCHNREQMTDSMNFQEQNISPLSTFLGLTDNCRNCHFDEHRGQFQQDCATCHSVDGWKPVTNFVHDSTDFPLTGRHTDVLCGKCHPTLSDNSTKDGGQFAKFTGVEHSQCVDCHTDAHNGSLGTNCISCHSTEGWRQIASETFDHSTTRYPLAGRHAQVACEKCHKPGNPRGSLTFAYCTDCHSDYHQGDFADRTSGGNCEECHTVKGFTPSTFTSEEHNRSAYPLTGAHQAVPCVTCHYSRADMNSQKHARFSFATTACTECHSNPHGSGVVTLVEAGGCESCHNNQTWRSVSFDHSQTKFQLGGAHAKVACVKCHGNQDAGSTTMLITALNMSCQSCHDDPHKMQFESTKDNGTNCARCHDDVSWKSLTFDHNQDSRFSLEGAHKKTPCSSCHKSVEGGTVMYKPLDAACISCHSSESLKNRIH